jgi:hypothetical protein
MEIPFPTSSASWIAKDPYEWSTHLRSSLSIPTPSFRSALRELAGRGNIPHNLNDQSLWILIHGLINVSWTLLWRDLGELSMVHENKITGWKDSLRRAFGVWVRYVEARSSAGGMEEALYTVGIPFAQLGTHSTFSVKRGADVRFDTAVERYRDDQDFCRCCQCVTSSLSSTFSISLSLVSFLGWRSASRMS